MTHNRLSWWLSWWLNGRNCMRMARAANRAARYRSLIGEQHSRRPRQMQNPAPRWPPAVLLAASASAPVGRGDVRAGDVEVQQRSQPGLLHCTTTLWTCLRVADYETSPLSSPLPVGRMLWLIRALCYSYFSLQRIIGVGKVVVQSFDAKDSGICICQMLCSRLRWAV